MVSLIKKSSTVFFDQQPTNLYLRAYELTNLWKDSTWNVFNKRFWERTGLLLRTVLLFLGKRPNLLEVFLIGHLFRPEVHTGKITQLLVLYLRLQHHEGTAKQQVFP
jgi:hypothetical protein